MTEKRYVNYTAKDVVAEYSWHFPKPEVGITGAHPENVFVRTYFFVKKINYDKNEVVYDVLVQSNEIGETRMLHLTDPGWQIIKINNKTIFGGKDWYTFPYNNLPYNFNKDKGEGASPNEELPYYVFGNSIGNYNKKKWYAFEEVTIKNDIFGDGKADLWLDLEVTFSVKYTGGYRSVQRYERATIKLPRIDRTSYVSNLEHGYFDEPITFNVNKRHPSFRDEVFYKVEDSDLIPIEYDGNGKCTFTIDQNLMRKFPKKDNANVYIQIVTYTEDGEKLHSDLPLHKEVIQINPNLKPTITEFRLRNTNTKVAELLGDEKYLQGISGIKCDLMNETPTFGAEIVKREVKIDTISKSGTTTIFEPINKTGRIFCTAYLEDSRGRNATYNKTIEFDSYYLPVIQSFFCARKEGSLGRNVTSLVSAKAKPLIKNNVNVNKWNVKIEYSIRRANSWATCYEANVNVENFNQTVPLGDFFDLTTGYDFRLTVADKLYTQVSNITISTINSTMVLGRNNIGIGKAPANHRTLDVEGVTNSSRGFAIDDAPIQNWQLTNNDGLALRTETDCDLILKSGFYYVYPATHSPEGRAIYLFAIEGKKGFYAQIAIDQRSRKMYTRTKWVGIAWQRWTECGGGDGQLFKLTQDDGYSKRPNVSSWDNVTEAGNYYGEGLSNAITPSVGRMHCIVTTPKKGYVMQLGSDTTNNTFGIRTQDGGSWTDWRVLGSGGGVRVYPVTFTNGAKASSKATEADNKIYVKDGFATIRLRADLSRMDVKRNKQFAIIPREIRPNIPLGNVTGYGHDAKDRPQGSFVLKSETKSVNGKNVLLLPNNTVFTYDDYYGYGNWEV